MFEDQFEQVVMQIPREQITARLFDVDKLTAVCVSGSEGAGRLASTLIVQTASQLAHLDANSLAAAQDCVLALMANAMAGSRGQPSEIISESQEHWEDAMSDATNKARFTASLLMGAVMVSIVAPPAAAQDAAIDSAAAEQEEGGLDTIVVTAQKREEALQDSPIAITAASGDTLIARGVEDIPNLRSITPNLVFDTTAPVSGVSSGAIVFIRGVGQTDFHLPTTFRV